MTPRLHLGGERRPRGAGRDGWDRLPAPGAERQRGPPRLGSPCAGGGCRGGHRRAVCLSLPPPVPAVRPRERSGRRGWQDGRDSGDGDNDTESGGSASSAPPAQRRRPRAPPAAGRPRAQPGGGLSRAEREQRGLPIGSPRLFWEPLLLIGRPGKLLAADWLAVRGPAPARLSLQRAGARSGWSVSLCGRCCVTGCRDNGTTEPGAATTLSRRSGQRNAAAL